MSDQRSEPTRLASLNRNPIDGELLAAIGQLLIGTSDLDDILSLMLFRLVPFAKPEDGFIVLGRLAISEKIKRLAKLVERKGSDELKSQFAQLKPVFSRIFLFRNAFAHGIYQGTDAQDGALVFAFTTHDLFDQEENSAAHESIGILPSQLKELAISVAGLVSELEAKWELKDWRAARYEQHFRLLQPHQRPR